MRRALISLFLIISISGCVAPNSSSVKDYGDLPEALPKSEGELLFVDIQCTVCHGHTGAGNGFLSEGLASAPPDFTSSAVMKSKTDSDLEQAIRNGKGKVMPAYPRLTHSQVKSLVRYIRGLARDS